MNITYTISQAKQWGSLTDEQYNDLFAGKYKQITSEQEVNKLSIGTQIIVWWSGGNGPHIYEVCSHDYSGTQLQTIPERFDSKLEPTVLYADLDFIGEDKPFTLIWLYKKYEYAI